MSDTIEKPLSYLGIPSSTIPKMEEEIARGFMNLCVAEMENNPELQKTIDDMEKQFPQGQAILNRLRAVGMEDKVSNATIILLCLLADSHGDISLWCFTLHELYQREQKVITLREIGFAFPNGFPNDEQRSKIWKGQKGTLSNGSDGNKVDDMTFYHSPK